MKNLFLTLILLVALPFSVSAAQTAEKKVYQFYVDRNMSAWKTFIDSLEACPNLTKEQRWELLSFEYGYVAWRLGDENKDKQEADAYLQKAYAQLEAFREDSVYAAEAKAYDAAFIGFQIGIHPIKAPFIGLRSKHFIQEALEMDSMNYFIRIQHGNIKYYLPPAFGGSKSEALHDYLLAEQFMREANLYQDNWVYMNLILTLADAYKREKNFDKVEEMYHWALQLNPSYSYVKDQLVPGLQNIRAKEAAKKKNE